MSVWFLFLMQFTLIAYAVVCGVFLGFSDFIMRSLARTPDDGGIEAMQSINREVFRWIFMGLFLGLAPVSVGMGLYGVIYMPRDGATYVAAASLVYVIGCFGVTIRFNVPMNETLAAMPASDKATKAYWTQIYLPNWTYWNSVRSGACGLASVLLLVALMHG